MTDSAIISNHINAIYPFLTIITPAYRRPKALARHLQALEAQTFNRWQHIILSDEVGHDWAWVGRQIMAAVHLAAGEYVMILDDDDELASQTAIADLRYAIFAHEQPDVVVCRLSYLDPAGQRYDIPEPEHWCKPPEFGHIGGQCIVASRSVFVRHAHALQPMDGTHGACDFPFAASVLNRDNRYRVYWWPYTLGAMQTRGNGQPERVTA